MTVLGSMYDFLEGIYATANYICAIGFQYRAIGIFCEHNGMSSLLRSRLRSHGIYPKTTTGQPPTGQPSDFLQDDVLCVGQPPGLP